MRVFLTILTTLAFAALPAHAADPADLQARIDAAPVGSTLEVPAGIYPGPIVVKQSLHLVGKSNPVIDGNGKGDVVIFCAPESSITGFVIRGSGDSLDLENAGVRVLGSKTRIERNQFEDVLFGVDLKNASDCVIRGNHIGAKSLDIARRGDALRLFRSNNCLIEDNVVEDGRDALLWYSNHIVVKHNVSRRNRYGFHMMYSNDVTLEDNIISDNSVGIYLMYGKTFRIAGNQLLRNRGPSGYGLGLKEIDAYQIENNVLAGNRVGTYIDGSPYTRKLNSHFTRNLFACNDVGMAVLPAVKGNKIYENNFIDNIEQIAVMGRGEISGNAFSDNGHGNFWSDYTGYDANHDGVGDQPYQARKLFESLIDREPKLRLLLLSPAHDAIEFIGRAMPAVRPEPKFSDASPLLSPVQIAMTESSSDSRGGLLLLASIFAGLPILILALLFRDEIPVALIQRSNYEMCHD